MNPVKLILATLTFGLALPFANAAEPAIWGSKHTVPALFIGAGSVHSTRVFNPTTATPSIEIILYTDSGKHTVDAGTAVAEGVTNLTTAIDTYMANNSLSGTIGLQIIISEPDTYVYSKTLKQSSGSETVVPTVKEYLLEDPTP